jgi:hypothetical protein
MMAVIVDLQGTRAVATMPERRLASNSAAR